jgi:hypothetical protein
LIEHEPLLANKGRVCSRHDPVPKGVRSTDPGLKLTGESPSNSEIYEKFRPKS